jgi:hypothetical protein
MSKHIYTYTGLFKMIHPISNDYIFEVYKYRVISDTSQTVCRGATVTVEPSRGDLLKLGEFLFYLVYAKLIHG